MSRTCSILLMALSASLAACGGGNGKTTSPGGDAGTNDGSPNSGNPDGSMSGSPDMKVVTVKPGSVPPTPTFKACTTGALSFGAPSNVLLGTGFKTQHDIVAVDLDGDGNTDFAANTTDADGDASVTVALGKGDGTFKVPVAYQLLAHVQGDSLSLAAADFDGDGKFDLVGTSNADNLEIGILINKGDGTFAAPVVIATDNNASDESQEIRVGDLNGDGAIDFVIGNDDGFLTMINNGDGTFPMPVVNATTSGSINGLTLGDFNGDKQLDVACDDSNYAAVFLDAKGVFDPSKGFEVNTPNYTPGSFAAGDLNADGKLDLVSWGGGDGIEVMLGNGDGTLQTPNYLSANNSNFGQNYGVLLDFDGDGKLDYITACGTPAEEQVCFAKGAGDGTFASVPHAFDVFPETNGISPYHLAVGDFNKDGIVDVAAMYDEHVDSVTVLLGTCK